MAFLFPAPDELELVALAPDARGMIIHVRARRRSVPCPDCAEPTDRIHSRYIRTLADLPWHGTPVRLRVQARRFFCPVQRCERRIFAERLSGTAHRHGRNTLRLGTSVRQIALVLGGEAASRLSRHLGVKTSPDTLLRRIRADASSAPLSPAPRVLGVDEWAYRKGRNYGTILVDLERSRVVDLLPDRSADSFAAWLQEHPGVEVITRDRSGIYTEGARRGAPTAVQVADRWHLLRNLTDAVLRALDGHSGLLRQAAAHEDSSAAEPPVAAPPVSSTRAEQAKANRRARRRARYDEVVALGERGLSRRQIAEQVGIERRTVYRWLSAGRFPERKERAPAESRLAPYYSYINERFAEGCDNASRLFREVQTRGYPGGRSIVAEYVSRLRRGSPPVPASALRRPSARSCAWWLSAPQERLSAAQLGFLERLAGLSPEIALMGALAQEFRRMLKDRDMNALGPWVEAARRSLLRRFAAGIHADAAAVRAAIELPWSNGPVEGQVNRLKMIKRQMYGRANFDLLRERVLHAA